MNRKVIGFIIGIAIIMIVIGSAIFFFLPKKEKKEQKTEKNKNYICIRAKKLHKEKCKKTSKDFYCRVNEYKNGEEIVYGHLGRKGQIHSGDAFDCDVNNDGKYNEKTERFYYVVDLDSDRNYGVLVYYNDVSGGIPNNKKTYAYDESANAKKNGPVTAVKQLPTTSQWTNVSLSNTTRKIRDEERKEYIDFSYEGYAARLLTTVEVQTACDTNISIYTDSKLKHCNFLAENIIDSKKRRIISWWLETPVAIDAKDVWTVEGPWMVEKHPRAGSSNAANNILVGVRPAIEVPKSKIKY